jgi:pimeloyl-ACP methyl ester carboxylesterase
MLVPAFVRRRVGRGYSAFIDPYDSVAARKRLGELSPRLQVEVVDGVGHDMDLLAPDTVCDRILRDSLRA